MNQPALPFQSQSHTSRIAAKSAAPRAAVNRTRVLEAIIAAGVAGLIDDEGMIITGIDSYRPRRIGLVADGLVCDSGRTRLTRSNRSATVWIYHTHKQQGQS